MIKVQFQGEVCRCLGSLPQPGSLSFPTSGLPESRRGRESQHEEQRQRKTGRLGGCSFLSPWKADRVKQCHNATTIFVPSHARLQGDDGPDAFGQTPRATTAEHRLLGLFDLSEARRGPQGARNWQDHKLARKATGSWEVSIVQFHFAQEQGDILPPFGPLVHHGKKKRGRLPCSKALRRWRSLSVAVCSGRSVAEANGTPLATAPFITPPLPRSRISRQASRSIKKQGEKWRQCSDSFQMSRVSCEDRPILLKNEFLAVPKSLLRFVARTW